MEKYINDFGKEVWKGVDLDTQFSGSLFHEVEPPKYDLENDYERFIQRNYQRAFHSELGSITVLDRMTGFGWRDVETGFRDINGNFWLASGNIDVITSGSKTVGEAIEWIKARANTCVPEV